MQLDFSSCLQGEMVPVLVLWCWCIINKNQWNGLNFLYGAACLIVQYDLQSKPQTVISTTLSQSVSSLSCIFDFCSSIKTIWLQFFAFILNVTNFKPSVQMIP